MSLTLYNFRNSNPAYLNDSNQLQKKPVYFCKFGLVTGPLGTNSQVLPFQFCTGPILSQTVARYRYMKNPMSSANQLDVINCTSTLSDMQFVLEDVNGFVSSMVSTYTMKNRLITVYAGYADIPESQYIPIYGGQVDNVQQTTDLTGWTITVTAGLKQLLNNILGGHTTLTADYHPGDNIAFVSQLNYFARMTDFSDGLGARNYIKIEESIYSYSGLGTDVLDGTVFWQWRNPTTSPSGNTVWPSLKIVPWAPTTTYAVGNIVNALGNIYKCVQSGTSGASAPTSTGIPMIWGMTLVQPNGNGVTVDSTHQASTAVDNFVLFQGNPITIMLQIILSTGDGTNHAVGATNYDAFPAQNGGGQGVGVPYSLVNISNFETLRNKYFSWMYFSQYLTDAVQAIQFFEDEFNRQICGWLFENLSGQVDFACFYVAQGTNDAIQIDDTNMVGKPQFNGNLQTGQTFTNEVFFQYDYSTGLDQYLSQLVVDQTDSQQKYEELSQLEIDSKMISSYYGGYQTALRSASIFNSLFSVPPPLITLNLLYGAHLLQPGMICYLQSKYLPNYKAGTRGGASQLCICINAQPDYSTGKVQCVLLGIGFVEQRRFAGFAADNVPSFATSTAAQQLANAYFVNDTTGFMPDGTAPYVFAP
jgi:hypothetical protein